MIFYRARYYHAGIGRFVSRDPMGMADAVSGYAYVANNPVMMIDPWGAKAQLAFAGAGTCSYTGCKFSDADIAAAQQGFVSDFNSQKRVDQAVDFVLGFIPGYDIANKADKGQSITGGDVAWAVVGVAPIGKGGKLLKGAEELASSKVLGAALENEGFVRQAGDAAHHLVAGGAKAAAEARDILSNFGVGINDAANGVFLPATKALAQAGDAVAHAAVHTGDYYRSLTAALRQAASKQDVLDILARTRDALLNGGKP